MKLKNTCFFNDCSITSREVFVVIVIAVDTGYSVIITRCGIHLTLSQVQCAIITNKYWYDVMKRLILWHLAVMRTAVACCDNECTLNDQLA